MQEHTNKRPTEGDMVTVCYTVHKKNLAELRKLVAPFVVEVSKDTELLDWDDAFPPLTPGEALKGARLKNSLTQKELSEKIGIHANHISSMENNKRSIGKDMAKRFAHVLAIDYRVLL